MGGGGVMRAAGKFAGLGVVNGSLRGGLSSVAPAEQSLRNVSRPASATISSTKVSGDDVAMGQKATMEMDWEFAGGEEDLVVESSQPMARVVFGGAPSLQEAKDATSDLKDALDKVYLSSVKTSAYECGSPVAVGQVTGMPLLSNSVYSESNSCSSYNSQSESVSVHAMQAFKMLSESSAAQSVVASIASDPNVWDAVMQNEALVGFLQSENASIADSVSSTEIYESSLDSVSNQSGEDGKANAGFLDKIKHAVMGMANNVADFVKNIFGISGTASGSNSANANPGSNLMDKTLGTSFLALAVMAIIVVVLKRGA